MDVKLPHLGEGADSGTVVNLFVKEGDQIAKDQPILELENEKAVASIPASAAGAVTKVFVKVGDKISVGQKILSLSGSGKAEAPAKAAGKPAAKKPAPEAESEEAPEEEAPEEKKEEEQAPEPEEASEPEAKSSAAIAAPPSIRKLAKELGLDLSPIRGSARGGRITMDDVRRYIQRLQKLAAQPKAAGAPGKPATEAVDFSKWGGILKKPLSPLRQVIAQRMSESWNTVPRVTQFDDADITGILALRKKHLDAYEKQGARLTVTSFVLKAVADTLKKHPMFNSSLDEAAQEIIIKEYIHIGIAVDTDAGLIVPVIRDVDKKNLAELSKELESLATKARERKISAEELKGGSFTISNQGGIGGAHFTPIVNKPEVAILGLGRAAAKPVVRDNKIEIRTLMPIGLSYDHRVIDGANAARFTVDLVEALENFGEKGLRI